MHALAVGLVKAKLMGEFHTCLDCPGDERWLSLLPAGLRREARRRRLPAEVKPFARLNPGRELGRLFGARLGLTWLGVPERGVCSVDAVYRALDRKVAKRLERAEDFRGVYLYEDGAAGGFAAARGRGQACFYDLPIGYWRAARRILGEESELSPEWAGTMAGNRDSDFKLARKDEELARADTVFVASSFTKSTLIEASSAPADVVVAPYGAPQRSPGYQSARRSAGEPLRVLFVGSLGQRKGLRYLLDAMEQLGGGYELTLIGSVPSARCDPLAAALRRHRHIASLPHGEILEEMGRHHVLVFPSLFEGFGLVLLEAMACGLPIVATPHTAAPDFVREGVDGFVVPIRSAGAIAERLTWLAADEDRRQAMGRQARLRAGEFTWSDYSRRVTLAIEERLKRRG